MISITFVQYYRRLACIFCCLYLFIVAPVTIALAESTSRNAQLLDWQIDPTTFCGGYYLDHHPPPLILDSKDERIHITGDETLFSEHDTTTLTGNVLFQRQTESISADKAIVYRDRGPEHRLHSIELISNVHLREPNMTVVANKATYIIQTKSSVLSQVMYRLFMQGTRPVGKHHHITQTEVNAPGGILTAWGSATDVTQTSPGNMALTEATYSTCPPINPTWVLKARSITLDQDAGRGSARHVTLTVRNIPVFYFPYVSFPIDARRKSGFLWPSLGTKNGAPYASAPFYWNMAPNYDMLITPTFFTNRGFMLEDQFRYLETLGRGHINVTVLPDDRYFGLFQSDNETISPKDSATTQASKTRLANASTTRNALTWRDDRRYNEHWSSHIDFNHTSDDYFLRDFGGNLNDVTQNQLLQEGEINYQSQHLYFVGRLQAYQTQHPFNETVTLNQYRRFPQLILNTNYPDQWHGIEFFSNAELTNFDIRKTPGIDVGLPVGQRAHIQPGISLPLSTSYGFITPRIQLALSEYTLHQTSDTDTPTTINRALPIIDVATGATLERNISVGTRTFRQTLEPLLYYTYIPYRRQFTIPLFDTSVNTPIYDQLFNYNRFSGLDRIGDANQLGFGVSTRIFDGYTGIEKMRFGIGDIVYFKNRSVTLCENPAVCNDYPEAHTNQQLFSPVTATLDYHLATSWNVIGNTAWDPVTKHINNASVSFHYQPDSERIINLGLNYIGRTGLAYFKMVPEQDNDAIGKPIPLPFEALKVTDFSFAWPITAHVSNIGRLSHDWASNHLQNALYGIQYDTCCVTIRLVANRTFLGVDPNRNNLPRYDHQFYIQLSLKGLGNVGNGNPQSLLNNITGYTNSHFG